MDKLKMRTWAEINLSNVRHNFMQFRERFPAECKILGVVKADGYGHGSVEISETLLEAGCDYLAVACFMEAMRLRASGIEAPLLILGETPAEMTGDIVSNNITQSVSDLETAREMSKIAEGMGKKIRVHVKIDSGMGRLGFDPRAENTVLDIAELVSLPGIDAEGIFTHFAVSDDMVDGQDYTLGQHRAFAEIIEKAEIKSGFQFKIKHCANSGAVVNYPQLHMDMVRPGLLMYGMYPGPEKGGIDLRPAMELKTRIACIREHPDGDSISYGRTWKAEGPRRIAVLPIGYADGFHRIMSGKIDVLIRGRRCPQVGRICMDMCMADVTGLPEAQAGDVVTLFGRDGGGFIPIEEQAEKAGTINYEFSCSPSMRVPRIYLV